MSLTGRKKPKALDEVSWIADGKWPRGSKNIVVEQVIFTPNVVTVYDVLVLAKVMHDDSKCYHLERHCYWWAKHLVMGLRSLDSAAVHNLDTNLTALDKLGFRVKPDKKGKFRGLAMIISEVHEEKNRKIIEDELILAKQKLYQTVCIWVN